ncbi:MAG: ketoacyl-ACP synthase III [Frankia sp.]|nr:ketoacyl-ACP synthase III [Frankia sp.]
MTALNVAPGAKGARIIGLGDHRPERVLTNADLESMVDTSDEWIRSRTGIERRHLAAPEETVVTMAVAAGGKALAASGVDPAEIDLVVVATCSIPLPVPGAAARVATALGAVDAGAVDVNGACAGFAYSLAWAADAVRGGSARNVLVCASEKLSSFVDYTDRATCIIFGDGAGAAVVGPSSDNGIGPVVWGSDGARSDAIVIPDGAAYVRMDGPAVFRWATGEMVDVCRRACDAAGVAPHDLAAFVPHQANLRIVDSLARSLGIPADRVSRDIVDTGNTSAASVPLALSRLVASGRLAPGDPILQVAFGAGLTYAGQVVCAP